MNKVIVRMMGGLGNQLFTYAAARRLAFVNDAELVIDDSTGFVRDAEYQRKYLLNSFNIRARAATPLEKLEPFEKYRRWLIKLYNRKMSFNKKSYLEQGFLGFDQRLLDLKIDGTIYLEGLCQSEKYFEDIEVIIREDLIIDPPLDINSKRIQEIIKNSNAVAIHLRWFNDPATELVEQQHNVNVGYYEKAIEMIDNLVGNPHYFVFSDRPGAARDCLALPEAKTTFVSGSFSDDAVIKEFWLMTQCKHFIIANSTYSWWGAWLSNNKDKIIIAPGMKMLGQLTSWGFDGLIPDRWIKL